MTSKTTDLIIKVFFAIAVVALGYWLFRVIQDPIIAQKKREKRKMMVIDRLTKAREAQSAYKEIHGHYADNWDSLIHTLKKDSFPLVRTIGDPNDTTITVERDTTYRAIQDSILTDYPIDSLQYAPLTGKKFEIDAKKIEQRGVNVYVFQIKDVKPIGDKTFTLGSLTQANYSGNW